jgi:hypothetical protein
LVLRHRVLLRDPLEDADEAVPGRLLDKAFAA